MDDNPLGTFLKNRRARLDPASFGIASTRRRTPGLRREEVAQRANVSATWYTWLEQGRGGMPSADVLDGIANALVLTDAEREHLFLLAQNRPPEVRYQESETVTPQLQRVLDAMPFSPALVKNVTWDIIAWNQAAVAVLGDYAQLAPGERNVLRMLFCTDRVRNKTVDWEDHARLTVAVFRADIARAGASVKTEALVEELIAASPEFEALWNEHNVRDHGHGTKQLRHSGVGNITLEFSAFAVDGHPDLGLVIYTAATKEDEDRMRSLVLGVNSLGT